MRLGEGHKRLDVTGLRFLPNRYPSMAVHVRWLVALCLFSIGPSPAWSADPAPAQESGPQGAEFDPTPCVFTPVLTDLYF